jgi:hypothetical protein
MTPSTKLFMISWPDGPFQRIQSAPGGRPNYRRHTAGSDSFYLPSEDRPVSEWAEDCWFVTQKQSSPRRRVAFAVIHLPLSLFCFYTVYKG